MSFQIESITSAFQTQIDYDGGTNPVYVGIAQPGQASGTACWQIKKITYDDNNNPTAVKYAGGTTEFVNRWDDRSSYVYS